MVNYSVDDKKLLEKLSDIVVKTEVYLKMRAATGAKKFENYAKRYRPWTDRTGNARRTLHGYVESIPNGIRICIAHGMSYGYSLEYEHERRYAILDPTVQALGADVTELVLNNLVRAWKA